VYVCRPMYVCMFLFVCLLACLHVCTVTDFSAAEKDSGVKLRTLVRLLSGQVFSHFGELWLVWSHGGGITSGMYGQRTGAKWRLQARLGGQSVLGR